MYDERFSEFLGKMFNSSFAHLTAAVLSICVRYISLVHLFHEVRTEQMQPMPCSQPIPPAEEAPKEVLLADESLSNAPPCAQLESDWKSLTVLFAIKSRTVLRLV